MIGNNEPELYDLSKDIGETKNIATQKPEMVKQLVDEYSIWERDVTANYQ